MDKDEFDELIERAKQGSKDDFLRFVTGVYGVDECVFDHMWEVPVIAPWDGDTLVTTPLSTKTEDEILDIVDDFIKNELGDADGCFISLDKMADEFTEEELEEWQEKLDSGELKLNYNAIIIYNESELQKQYKELVKAKPKTKTQEELDQIFVDYVKGVITHERCHLNANYLVTEVDKYMDEGVEKAELSSSEVNGASLTDIEQSNIITSGGDTVIINKYNDERNEVLVDTLRQMMNNYQEGDSIEDCLFRIIKDRDGKSQYTDLDDREVLTMYILFPEELTEWATFGAYDFIRENKLQKMIMNVCGTDMPLKPSQLKKKVEEYVATLEEGTLSDKQTEMLEMLGFSISRKIDREDMKEVATSEKALGALSGSLLDVKAFMQSMQKEDSIKEQ